MTTTASRLPLVSIANLRSAHIGVGEGTLDAYITKRVDYLGMVVAVSDEDVNGVYRRTVTVFDFATMKASTFVSDTILSTAMQAHTNGRASAWGVDARPETMAAYYKWHLSISLPTQALAAGESAKVQYIKDVYMESQEETPTPPLAKGQVYKVVRGRKVKHGTTGSVFWFGDKGWGMSVGLNTSDRKDSRGRNLDVVFAALKNLEYVPATDTTSTTNNVVSPAIRAAADGVAVRNAVTWYKNAVKDWIKQTGYDGDSVRQRLIEVIDDILKDSNTDSNTTLASTIALLALRQDTNTTTVAV